MNEATVSNCLRLHKPSGPAGATASVWTQVLSHLDPRFGGLSTVVPLLSSRLIECQHMQVGLAAFCDPDEKTALNAFPDLSLTCWPSARIPWLKQPALRHKFRDTLSCSNGIHIHGLWEASSVVAARCARKLCKPYIVSAHGMLEPWALANKGLKKWLYSSLIERSTLEGAACLHALTLAEAEDYRRFGSKRPIAIIPNGVSAPKGMNARAFLDRFPELNGKRFVLFLGRIHYKKGLDILMNAWAAIQANFPDIVLVLAGPNSENSRARLETQIKSLNIGSSVFFTGMLDTVLKWSALSAAYCFVLPSYSEGLSVATLEALSAGVPVIVTDHCHLPEVARYGAGWEISATKESLQKALTEAMELSGLEMGEIGVRGLQLVEERFSWSIIARQMADLYRWVETGSLPSTFVLLEATS